MVKMPFLLAGLFGHRHTEPVSPVIAPFSNAMQWAGAHWAVLAVIIPVGGAIVAGLLNHYLALARENRSRRVSRKETRARVYADLAARLLSHCSAVYGGLVNPVSADPVAWRSANASLRARSQMHDVVDALGGEYVSFMAAIEDERRRLATFSSGSVPAGGIAHIIESYVPFIDRFGEPVQAKRLQTFARQALKRSSATR
jgi:hypothetical protein